MRFFDFARPEQFVSVAAFNEHCVDRFGLQRRLMRPALLQPVAALEGARAISVKGPRLLPAKFAGGKSIGGKWCGHAAMLSSGGKCGSTAFNVAAVGFQLSSSAPSKVFGCRPASLANPVFVNPGIFSVARI